MYEKKTDPVFLVHRSEDSKDDYLMHYGIIGMKWGVRRFQNKDGSLTPKGRSRYQNDDSLGYGSMGSKDVKKYFNKNGSLTKKGEEKLVDKSNGIRHYTLNKEIRKALGYGDDVTEVQVMSDGSRLIKEKDYPDPDYGYRYVPNLTKEERIKHESEFSRRSKLTPEQSDKELRKIIEDNDKAFVDERYSKEESKAAQQKYLDLYNEIRKFSGDWYESYYVSDTNKASSIKNLQLKERESELKTKCNDMAKSITRKDRWNRNQFDEKKLQNNKEYQTLLKDYNTTKEKRRKSEDDHLGVVLKDLGYKDTTTARELIRDTVYWD